MRVVIAHDFMETYGDAERVTEQMALAFPDAPVVAILGREDVSSAWSSPATALPWTSCARGRPERDVHRPPRRRRPR